MKCSEKRTVDKYHIYVGLCDGKSLMQAFETEKYVAVVDYICKNNNISYTLNVVRGGYRMENGAYVNENTLDVMLIDAKREIVDALASELCALLKQECVLISCEKVEQYYLSEQLVASEEESYDSTNTETAF